MEKVILPDDADRIAAAISAFLNRGADLLITTGGMSVDPEGVTHQAISQVGVDRSARTLGPCPVPCFSWLTEGKPPLWAPACVPDHEAAIIDLILPRLLVGKEPDRHDPAHLAHGGLG